MPAKPPTDLTQCEAIRLMLAHGWTPARITVALRISRDTYQRRVREMRAAEVEPDAVRRDEFRSRLSHAG